jgi:deoxyadenosine/deoxycytidine kinase
MGPHYEDVVDNPYLDDFIIKWSVGQLNLQIYFLNSRFHQVCKFAKVEKKSFKISYEDAHILL